MFSFPVKFNLIVPRLSSVRRWSRTWTWPSTHHPAGRRLTATSDWSTRLNTCWKTTARYMQACLVIARCVSFYPFYLFVFSHCVTCLTLAPTFFIRSGPEEYQHAEGPIQRPTGALCLEPVDSLEKCNLLMLSECITSAPALSLFSYCMSTLSSHVLSPTVFILVTHWRPRD